MKIGIAITSHNRPEVCRETFNILNIWRPENSVIVVVDDASTEPPFGYWNNYMTQYRFENHVGVSVAKNKCLELLSDADCTHYFLFDDDCRPLNNEWWLPYVSSKLHHTCWTFDRKVIDNSHPEYLAFEKPNGCMMYFTNLALLKAGGWDLEFEGFGYEHCNVSDRLFNLGLTPARYIDIRHEKPPFELAKCETSFGIDQRRFIPHNLKLYQQKYYSKEFKPFK